MVDNEKNKKTCMIAKWYTLQYTWKRNINSLFKNLHSVWKTTFTDNGVNENEFRLDWSVTVNMN